jgi:hypothetical protein
MTRVYNPANSIAPDQVKRLWRPVPSPALEAPLKGGLSNPAETPRADPHAGRCGGWGLDTPGYPIMPEAGHLARYLSGS